MSYAYLPNFAGRRLVLDRGNFVNEPQEIPENYLEEERVFLDLPWNMRRYAEMESRQALGGRVPGVPDGTGPHFRRPEFSQFETLNAARVVGIPAGPGRGRMGKQGSNMPLGASLSFRRQTTYGYAGGRRPGELEPEDIRPQVNAALSRFRRTHFRQPEMDETEYLESQIDRKRPFIVGGVGAEDAKAAEETAKKIGTLDKIFSSLEKIGGIVGLAASLFKGITNWLSGGKKREEELKANKLNAVKEFMDKHGPNLMKTLEDINVSDMLGGRDLKEAWTISSSGKGGVWQWMYPGLVSPALEAKRDQTTAENGYDKAVADMAYWWTVVKYLWNAMSSHYASSNYHDAYFVMATLVGNKDLDIEAYNRNGGASVWGWNAISNFGVAVERLTGLYKKILEQKAAQLQAEIAKQTAKRKQDTVAGLSVAGVALLGGLTGLYFWKKRQKGAGAMRAQKGKKQEASKVFQFPAQYRKVAGRPR